MVNPNNQNNYDTKDGWILFVKSLVICILVVLCLNFFFLIKDVHVFIRCQTSCPDVNPTRFAGEIYFLVEWLIGSYFIVIFAFLFSCALVYGTYTALFSNGENLKPLLGGMTTVAAIQILLSGFEWINHWPVPVYEDNTTPNFIGSLFFELAYNLLGFQLAMSLWYFFLFIFTVLICQFVFNIKVLNIIIPFFNFILRVKKKRLDKMVDNIIHSKYGRKMVGIKEDEVYKIHPPVTPQQMRDSRTSSTCYNSSSRLEEKCNLDQNNLQNNPKISQSFEKVVPTLHDVVHTPTPMLKPKLQSQSTAQAQAHVVKQTAPASASSVKTVKPLSLDSVKLVMAKLKLRCSNLSLIEGPFIWRILATPDLSLRIRGEKEWIAAVAALALNFEVAPNDVDFNFEGDKYVYDIKKQVSHRKLILFKDVLNKIKIAREHANDLEDGLILPFLFGLNITGEVVLRCVTKVSHLFISGKSGSGKSSLLHVMLINMMRISVKKKIPILLYFSDINGATAIKYKPLLGTFVKRIATSHEETVSMLHDIKEIINNRSRIINEYVVEHIHTVNDILKREGKPQHPIIFVVLEEVATIFGNEDYKDEIGGLCSDIITTARKHGIIILTIGTQVNKTNLGTRGGTLLGQSGKISFQSDTKNAAQTYFGKPNIHAENLARFGDAYYLDNATSEVIRIHTPIFDKDSSVNDGLIKKWIGAIAKEVTKNEVTKKQLAIT